MRRSTWVFWTLVAALSVLGDASGDEGPSQSLTGAERDSLETLGQNQLQGGHVEAAIVSFTRLVEAFPEDARLKSRLAYSYLKNRDFDQAQSAFEAAKKLDKGLAEAYVGLGLVYTERPASGLSAFSNYRKAMGEAKRAAKADSTYAPAYRLLGELYERFQEDHEKAIKYYLKYVQAESDNPDGLYYFGLACVQADQYDKIVAHIIPYLQGHESDVQLLPLAAQGYHAEEEYRLALEYFERYLQQVDEEERAHYTDISLVGSEKELHALQGLSDPSERQAYLDRFWRRRDPDILTQINERIIEHYRRVWFVRTFFSKEIQPWDRRGEVYIRYGEPDYRSRSNQREFVLSPKVEAVRNRMAADIWGPAATYYTFTGPVFPIRSQRAAFTGNITTGNLNNGALGAGDGEDDVNLELTPGEEAEQLGFQFEVPDLVASSPFDGSVGPRME